MCKQKKIEKTPANVIFGAHWGDLALKSEMQAANANWTRPIRFSALRSPFAITAALNDRALL